MPGHRAVRLLQGRYRPDVRRQRGVQGVVRKDRQGRSYRDRQLLGLPQGPRRAADRARGEPGRHQGRDQEEHHRQPQLLDHPAGDGAEAAARCGQDQAGGRLDLSVGVRRRQGRHGRAVEPDQGHLRPGRRHAQEVPQTDRLQRHPLHRFLPRGRLHRRGEEDVGRDAQDAGPRHQGHRHLRARARLRGSLRGRECGVRPPHRTRRGPRHLARGAGRAGHR